MPPRFRNALATRLGLYTIAIASLVIAIGSAYEVRLQYQLVVGNTLDNAEQSLQLTTNAATEAVFQLDDRLAGEIVSSLMSNPAFLEVRITDELGNSLAEASRPKTGLSGINRVFELPPRTLARSLSIADDSGNSGSLEAVLDASAGLGSFFDTIVTITALVLVQVLGLAAVVYVIVTRLVTTPLAEMANDFSKIDPGGSERLSVPRKHEHDELGQLTDSANRYLDSASRYHTEHMESEQKLSQAQKMESIGMLTGGISHDFNNSLTVIMGNIELARNQPDASFKIRRYMDEAFEAAEKSASLTQTLLAFARKQPLRPEVIDLRNLVSGMEGLLRRTIRADIQIESINGGGLWNCEVDPVQFESAILNLVINARDSMPNGGKLTIETSNAYLDEIYAQQYPTVNPGQHVQLTVSDTGAGMSPETIAKAFDPFFTTKEEGQGSGLGLSMVYGFVQQSGGSINIYSELNEGTTIKIYMPRANKEPGNQLVSYATTDLQEGSGEAVLVVEDNQKLGEVVLEMLRELNFRPLFAANVDQAIEMLGVSDVDVVLTDVILPGSKKGSDLAAYVGENLPGVSVVFMSGYTENSIIHDGRLDPGVELLEKPFSIRELSLYINRALGREAEDESAN